MPNVTRTAPGRSDILRTWSIADSMDLYNVEQWSQGFFGMNEAGNVVVTPRGQDVAMIGQEL